MGHYDSMLNYIPDPGEPGSGTVNTAVESPGPTPQYGYPSNPTLDTLYGLGGNSLITGGVNAQMLGRLLPLAQQTSAGQFNTIMNDQSLINNQGTQNNNFYNTLMGNAGQLGALGNGLNQYDLGALGNYQSALGGYNAQNTQALGNIQGLYGQLATPLQSGVSWAGDLSSQAALAQADPQAIAAQQQALGFLQGAANGSLNYTSQAAQAYANAGDIANQQMAAGQLQNIANGSKDVDFASLPGIQDLYATSQGAKDIKPGQLDPESYAAAMDALHQFGALTTPQVTSQERFIYEQARQQQEQDERANREAVMTNLRQRGMSGSGMEIGQEALAGQQTSQNRLLSDLGAQSNAVARSMSALQGYGTLSGNLNAQANALAAQNQQTQLSALDQYTGLGANIATDNMNRQANAQQAASQAYATLRAQGFSEAYARGVAADTAAANNQQTQLQGGIASGNVASNMRQQSFNEQYLTGSAADQMAQYNRTNSLGVDMFNANYNAHERDALWGRGQDLTNDTLNVNAQNALNTTNSFNAQQHVSDNIYNRGKDYTTLVDDAATRNNLNQNAQTDRSIHTGDLMNQRLGDLYTNTANITDALASNNWNTTNAFNDVGSKIAGTYQADKASGDAAALAANNDPGGFLGIGGSKGLLGLGILGKHDPLWVGNWVRGSIK